MKDSLIGIHELSARLAIPVGSIRNALWRGQAGQTIPIPIRLGRRLRWSETEIEQFLESRVAITATTPACGPSLVHRTRGRPTKREELRRTNTLNELHKSGILGVAVGQGKHSAQTSLSAGCVGKSQ